MHPEEKFLLPRCRMSFEPRVLRGLDAVAGPRFAYNKIHAECPCWPRWAHGTHAYPARHRCRRQEPVEGDNMMRFIALFLIVATALLAGCNTVAGAGEDISKGGQAIHNSAEQAK
jgi:entericidin B